MGILARRWIVGQECPTYGFRSDKALASDVVRIAVAIDLFNRNTIQKVAGTLRVPSAEFSKSLAF